MQREVYYDNILYQMHDNAYWICHVTFPMYVSFSLQQCRWAEQPPSVHFQFYSEFDIFENWKNKKKKRREKYYFILICFFVLLFLKFWWAVAKWGGGVWGGGEARGRGRTHMRGRTAATIAVCLADEREAVAIGEYTVCFLHRSCLFC